MTLLSIDVRPTELVRALMETPESALHVHALLTMALLDAGYSVNGRPRKADPIVAACEESGAGPLQVQRVALGRAVDLMRMQLGLSRATLAQLAGMSYPYLCGIIAGEKSPSAGFLMGLASALECTPSELQRFAESLS